MKANFYRILLKSILSGTVTIAVFFLVCSCSQAPTAELADAEAALLSARNAGAEEFTPGEYASAEQMMARARTANEEGRYDDARASATSARDMADRARLLTLERRSERDLAERAGGEINTTRIGSGALGTGDMVSGLATVNFAYDSAILSSHAREILRMNYEWLRSRPSVHISIEGHCDERGSAEYNIALGELRAKAAKQYLTDLGIPNARITIVSFGEEMPIAAGHNETAWSQNRRAAFVIDRDSVALESSGQ